jgi:hypothetical protein
MVGPGDDMQLLGRAQTLDVLTEGLSRRPAIVPTGDEELGPRIVVQKRVFVVLFNQRNTDHATHPSIASGVMQRHPRAKGVPNDAQRVWINLGLGK